MLGAVRYEVIEIVWSHAVTDDRLLYQSSIIRGSYFNRMLHCGPFDRRVEIALEYLPRDVLDEHKDNLAFVSLAHRDATRLARKTCETRKVIILSEHILPRPGTSEGLPEVRYFIYAVLHEVAHAIKKHRSPLYDSLTKEEFEAQEKEADDLAFRWFNEHVAARKNPSFLAITLAEIDLAQAKSQELMRKLLDGDYPP
jgi:hypothetical protein